MHTTSYYYYCSTLCLLLSPSYRICHSASAGRRSIYAAPILVREWVVSTITYLSQDAPCAVLILSLSPFHHQYGVMYNTVLGATVLEAEVELPEWKRGQATCLVQVLV